MEYLILFLTALLPAAFYILYIVAFDSKKPEPPKVLLLAAALGGMAAVIVMLLERTCQLGMVNIEEPHSLKESLAIGFLHLAIPAEVAKWLLLCAFLSLNRFYDEYIDGIVYSVCLSMGYVGVWTAFFLSAFAGGAFSSFVEMSAVTVLVLVPISYIAGTLMGYFFALARDKKKSRVHYLLALLVPMLVDGFLCFLVLVIGNHWEYYFLMGILLAILATIVYTQIFKLLERDGIKFGNK